jgi:hypothetical protein
MNRKTINKAFATCSLVVALCGAATPAFAAPAVKAKTTKKVKATKPKTTKKPKATTADTTIAKAAPTTKKK